MSTSAGGASSGQAMQDRDEGAEMSPALNSPFAVSFMSSGEMDDKGGLAAHRMPMERKGSLRWGGDETQIGLEGEQQGDALMDVE